MRTSACRRPEEAADADAQAAARVGDPAFGAVDRVGGLGVAVPRPVEDAAGPRRVAGEDDQAGRDEGPARENRQDEAGDAEGEEGVAGDEGDDAAHPMPAISSHSGSLRTRTP